MASKAADADAPGPLIDLGMAPPKNAGGASYPKFSKRSWKAMGFVWFVWFLFYPLVRTFFLLDDSLGNWMIG